MVGYTGSANTAKITSTKFSFNAVTGTITATAKSFLIDHPTKPGMKLQYGSLEGPENGVYVRGRTQESIIELPDYWVKLINLDTVSVSLTPIGYNQMLFVEKVEGNRVYINNSVEGASIDCYFLILAERIDIVPLLVEI